MRATTGNLHTAAFVVVIAIVVALALPTCPCRLPLELLRHKLVHNLGLPLITSRTAQHRKVVLEKVAVLFGKQLVNPLSLLAQVVPRLLAPRAPRVLPPRGLFATTSTCLFDPRRRCRSGAIGSNPGQARASPGSNPLEVCLRARARVVIGQESAWAIHNVHVHVKYTAFIP